MIDQRDPEQKLKADMGRFKAERDEARAVIEEQNIILLGVGLKGRLIDPTDFRKWVEMEDIVDHNGRLLWHRITKLVDELLTAKPYLGAPEGNPGEAATAAVGWFTNGTG